MTMLFDFNIFNIGRTRLLLVAVLLFSAVAAGAQSGVTVTGTVSDSDGNPLIGAAVMEQGTNNGAVTDIDGKYSIVVRGAGSVLVFNSLSYMTETMTVGDRNVINVALKDDALSLSESVVTGYGRTVSRDKLTAAISKVSGRYGHGCEGGYHFRAAWLVTIHRHKGRSCPGRFGNPAVRHRRDPEGQHG